MPRVLLIGCPPAVIEGLSQHPRWDVAVGVHEAMAHTIEVANRIAGQNPDPSEWNLILDACAHTGEDEASVDLLDRLSLPLYAVTHKYLSEADRAHGIRVVSREEHIRVTLARPQGEKWIQFNPVGEAALHLHDFVEEFEGQFVHGRLCYRDCRPFPSGTRVAFVDCYADPVVVFMGKEPDWLYVPTLKSERDVANMLMYLGQRTAPKIWPDIFAGSFRPAVVEALTAERDRVVAERRELEKEFDRRIRDEQEFFSRYANMLHVGDDALKLLIRNVLEEVLKFVVRDLDEQIQEGDPKRLDLFATSGDFTAVVEVRGVGTRNAKIDPDLDRFEQNVTRSDDSVRNADARVLIFNGMYRRPDRQRSAVPTFSQDVVAEAVVRGITLVSTQELLLTIESLRAGQVTVEVVVAALGKPGLFARPVRDT